MCISIGSTDVTWHFSQTDPENSTIGARCTSKEPATEEYTTNANCSDLKLYQHIKNDSGSYWCHIVTPLERLEHCTVENTSNSARVCDIALPVCAYCRSQTKCVAQIKTTPVLP